MNKSIIIREDDKITTIVTDGKHQSKMVFTKDQIKISCK
jgi:hypothetical protein